jgi:hypothetical protein
MGGIRLAMLIDRVQIAIRKSKPYSLLHARPPMYISFPRGNKFPVSFWNKKVHLAP